MKKNEVITLDTTVVRNDKKYIASPIGDELVMMSMESGSYIGMNEVGTAIWNKLEQPTLVSRIVNYLLEKYDITEEDCSLKTIKHLNELLKQNLLTIVVQ